jgi:hypothetical protein
MRPEITLPHLRAQGDWGRLPNAVVRDEVLDAASLVMLGYRATFGGEYALNVAALLAKPIVRAGLSRHVIKRGIANYVAAGYVKRWQPPSRGRKSFSFACEKLTLPPCGASGKAYRVVFRELFDGTLSAKEIAAYLYLRAGTGRGPYLYSRELGERFGWSRQTVSKVLNALVGLNLAKRTSAGYGALEMVEPMLKKGATKKGAAIKRATHERFPLHERSYPSRKGHYAIAAQIAPPVSERHDYRQISPFPRQPFPGCRKTTRYPMSSTTLPPNC